MFTATLFRIVNNQKQVKYPSIGGWVNSNNKKDQTDDICHNIDESYKALC